jgi:hypothetical protein
MSLTSQYQDISVQQKIPNSTKILEMLGKADLVKDRYSSSNDPYSGSNAGIGSGYNSKLVFKLFNNADYLDSSTAYITFNAKFTDASGTTNFPHLSYADCVASWFSSARILVNDQNLEEISNFNIYANLLVYASMSKSYYETSASFMGCVLHSKYIAGGPRGLIASGSIIVGAAASAVGTIDLGIQVGPAGQGGQNWELIDGGGPSWVPSGTATTAPTLGSGASDSWNNLNMRGFRQYNGSVNTGQDWCMPLAGFFGLFSLDKYFPLRSVASITVELNLPTQITGIVYDNILPTTIPASIAGITLALSNIKIHYDCVKMSDEYYRIMDEQLLSPEGMGAQFTVNTVEGTVAQIPVGPGKKSLIVSKGTRFLKSVWACQQLNSLINSGIAPPTSCFLPNGYQNHQFVVNSKRFPTYLVDNSARAFSELQKSLGKFHNVNGDSIITQPKYTYDIVANGLLSLNAYPDAEYATFIIGQNFESVIDAPEVVLDGQDTITAGFQITLEFASNAYNASTMYMFPYFSKVLKIQGGSIQILN